MNFEKLSKTERQVIINAYQDSNLARAEMQDKLSERFGVCPRTIRNWAKKLEVGLMKSNITNPSKVMIYDIETSRIPALVWWSGKQFVRGDQLMEDPKIITVAWKWLGSDEVYYLTWDEEHNDRKLLQDFLAEYNKADLVIGYNNDNFDNRWINARAMAYGLEVNTFVRSLDLMKESKRLFRTPSYSLASMAKLTGVTLKQSHEGLKMWDKIQFGTPEEQKEYLQKMVDYNLGDIISTEELYLKLRKYIGYKTHLGVLSGGERWSCPNCGGENVFMVRRSPTPAGTIQVIMQCEDDGTRYKISNKQYMNFLEYQMKDYVQ